MSGEPIACRLFAQTLIEHERRLPEAGEVLVAPGDWVECDDIVARYDRPGPVRVIDAVVDLGIARERLGRALRVSVGQEVEAGQVLAAAGFMGWRTVRSPMAGRVAQIATGRIFVAGPPVTVELQAHLPGQVLRVTPRLAVVIQAAVSRIVGAWGTGGECHGPLVMRSEAASDTLRWIGVDLGCRGKIVVGGQCQDARVLLRAARFRVQGLVVGGLAEHLRPRAAELGLPVMVTDGLGAVPMAAPVFEMVARLEGRVALLSGGREAHAPGVPQLCIPLDAVRGPVNVAPERPLVVGDRVRITRAPHLGATGWVHAFLEEDGENWVKVTLDQGQTATVKYRNLERLG